MTTRTYDINNPANPAKITDLVRTLDKHNIALQPHALIVDEDASGIFEVCPLHDAFIFCLENREENYIQALKNNFSKDLFLNNTMDEDGLLHYPLVATPMAALSTAINIAAENQFDEQDMSYASLTDTTLRFEFGDQNVDFTRINKTDITPTSPSLIKRAQKAMKGVHMGMSSAAIAKRLSAIEGFEEQTIAMGYGFGKGTNNHQKPMDLSLNNFVSIFRDIINRFAVEAISLSQARAIFCDYYQIKNWHQIKHTEDKGIIPAVVSEGIYSEDSDSYTGVKHLVFENVAAAVAFVGKKMKSHTDNFTVRHTMDGLHCTSGNLTFSVYTTFFYEAGKMLPKDEAATHIQEMIKAREVRGADAMNTLLSIID